MGDDDDNGANNNDAHLTIFFHHFIPRISVQPKRKKQIHTEK